MEEVAAANAEQIRRKELMKVREKEEDLKIIDYIRQKDLKEQVCHIPAQHKDTMQPFPSGNLIAMSNTHRAPQLQQVLNKILLLTTGNPG